MHVAIEAACSGSPPQCSTFSSIEKFVSKERTSLEWHSQAEAHALVTRGCAPPVRVCFRIIGADRKLSLSITNRALNSLHIEWRSTAMFIHRITSLIRTSFPYIKVTYTALQYGLRINPGGCKISKFFWESMPQTP